MVTAAIATHLPEVPLGNLVLSRHRDESIVIGGEITVTVVDIRGDKVRLAVNAPQKTTVHRREVYDAITRAGGDPTKRAG